MIKTESQCQIDAKSLQVANELRPMLEANLNTKFIQYVPTVYQDDSHNPDKNIFSLSISVEVNKTIYVTAIQNPEGSPQKYHILKLKLLP